MRFGNRRVFWGISIFFLLGGVGLTGIGALSPVTSFLDANSSADSDPAGGVLQLIGVIWTGTAILLIAIGLLITRAGSRDSDLQRTGIRAPATIDSVETTGVILNNVNAGIRLAVTVQPPGGGEFEASIKTYVPLNDLPQSGDLILVAYDPGRADRITAVGAPGISIGGGRVLVAPDGTPLSVARQARAAAAAATGAGAGAAIPPDEDDLSPVEQLEKLASLHEKGLLTDSEFQAGKYKILTGS